MNIYNILQAHHQSKAPSTNYPQEAEICNPVCLNLTRELQELQEVRETLLALPCSQKVEPIVAQLSDIIGLARDQGRIDMNRLEALVRAAGEGVTTM